MTTEITALATQHSALSPLSKGEVINELSSCLALVRPVSMSEDMATEWLTVAAGEVAAFAALRPGMFRSMCGTARQTATHHGQIVPKILAGQWYDWENKSKPLKLPTKPIKQLDGGATQKLISAAARTLTQR